MDDPMTKIFCISICVNFGKPIYMSHYFAILLYNILYAMYVVMLSFKFPNY
jgi:hypothetical protein